MLQNNSLSMSCIFTSCTQSRQSKSIPLTPPLTLIVFSTNLARCNVLLTLQRKPSPLLNEELVH